MNHEFTNALIDEDMQAIRSVPKTDFHNHSIFGARLERVETWAGITLQRPPPKMNGLTDMRAYVGETLNPHINSQQGFEFTAESALTDAIEDGVAVVEMSFGARFALFYPNQEQGFISFLDSLKTKHQSEITLRPELGFIREDFSSKALDCIARTCIETGFFHSMLRLREQQYGHLMCWANICKHSAHLLV